MYAGMVIFVIVVSMAGPIDRAVFYFKVIGFFFSLMTISTLIGITYFLVSTGFYPAKRDFIQDNAYSGHWEVKDPNDKHFNILAPCGYIMLGVYITPILLRPMDFLMNFTAYTIGMLTYIFMLPTFVNIM